MKQNDLINAWTLPEPTHLTSKQISLRLPYMAAAKINALCETFPNKTKTEIIGDLLTAALDKIENSLSSKPAFFVSRETDYDAYVRNPRGVDPDEVRAIYRDSGKRGHYLTALADHVSMLEVELGLEETDNVPHPYIYDYGDRKLEIEAEEDSEEEDG